MSKFAWVTLTTNDSYSLGALVLAHSLKRAGTVHQLAVLVTPGVSEAMRDRLKDVYNVVQEVNVLDSQDAANLALLSRPELGVTFTKLHCWRLVQFEKCVFLDSDTLVLQNSDELFEREELSAAPDVSWPDCFNSGVFVFKPSLETFAKIIEFALKNGSFDGGDQGLLNQYFSDWAHTDIQKHLPFIYNVTAYASYCYLPAFKQFRDKIKILHFAGKMKPWLIQFNSESKTASTPTDYAHASDLIQTWWNIFCDNVHQKLSDNMTYWPALWNFYEQNFQRYQAQDYHAQYHHEHHKYHHHHYQFQVDETPKYIDNDVADFYDPWEVYYDNLEKQKLETPVEVEMHENNYSIQSASEEESTINDYVNDANGEAIEILNEIVCSTNAIEQNISNNEYNTYTNQLDTNTNANTNEDYEAEIHSKDTSNTACEPHDTKSCSADLNALHATSNETAALLNNSPEPALNNVTATQDNILEEQHEEIVIEQREEAGLAGALSQLRLGEQRTPEQEAYEQLMRRQCWEAGQIDYSGKDSFENIWKKISETLEAKPTQEDDKSGSS